MQQEDYIERMIRQVAQAIDRTISFAQKGDVKQAKEEIRATWMSALALRREDIMRLDPATLRAILGSKRELAIKLLEAEVELGDREAARVLESLL